MRKRSVAVVGFLACILAAGCPSSPGTDAAVVEPDHLSVDDALDVSSSDTQRIDDSDQEPLIDGADTLTIDDVFVDTVCSTTCNCCGHIEVLEHDCGLKQPCWTGFCDWWCLGDSGPSDLDVPNDGTSLDGSPSDAKFRL